MNWGNLSSGLLGAMIGALFGALAAWRIERTRWTRDCRKQEWRELLDSVSAAERSAAELGMNPTKASFEHLDTAVAFLVQATNDRLFLPKGATDEVAIKTAEVRLGMSLRGIQYARSSALEFVRLRETIAKEAKRNLGLSTKPVSLWRWKRSCTEPEPKAESAANG